MNPEETQYHPTFGPSTDIVAADFDFPSEIQDCHPNSAWLN